MMTANVKTTTSTNQQEDRIVILSTDNIYIIQYDAGKQKYKIEMQCPIGEVVYIIKCEKTFEILINL